MKSGNYELKSKRTRSESGQVLILVLLLMLVGLCIITPSLALAATSIKSVYFHSNWQKAFYASDSYTCDFAWYKIQQGVETETFTGRLNDTDVTTTITLVSNDTLWEFRYEIVDAPYGAEVRTIPGVEELDITRNTADGIGTIEVSFDGSGGTGSGDSFSIKSLGMWLLGDYSYVRPIEGFDPKYEPEVLPVCNGTSFIWKVDSCKLTPEESKTYSFEYSGRGDPKYTVAWVQQSSNIWITSTGWDTIMRTYKVVSVGVKGSMIAETTGYYLKMGDFVKLLSYEIERN